jgi:hypothetical protein
MSAALVPTIGLFSFGCSIVSKSDYCLTAAIWWYQSKITQFHKLISRHDFVNIWRNKCNLSIRNTFVIFVADYAIRILKLLLNFGSISLFSDGFIAARDRKTESGHSGFSTQLTFCCKLFFFLYVGSSYLRPANPQGNYYYSCYLLNRSRFTSAWGKTFPPKDNHFTIII